MFLENEGEKEDYIFYDNKSAMMYNIFVLFT